jgi:uncharacterized protein
LQANSDATGALAEKLIDQIASFGRVVVAFSGGVDSSVVAAAAYCALPTTSLAVTAVSPSVATWQREVATKIAAEIGIDHQWIQTDEVGLAAYRRNDAKRCFHCKKTLYGSIDVAVQSIRSTLADATILSGTNADDLCDYRPGIKAGTDAGVKTPLADLGIGKAEVRSLAAHFGLSNDNLPASPCLASRVAYGIEVTPERLSRIDKGESWLRERGFSDVRVRLLKEVDMEIARVEVPLSELDRLREIGLVLTSHLMTLGFDKVTIDPAGLRSGNLNEALVSLGRLDQAESTVQTSQLLTTRKQS